MAAYSPHEVIDAEFPVVGEHCDCASRHLKVIGEFEAEAKELRAKLEELTDWFADAEGAVKNIRRILGPKP